MQDGGGGNYFGFATVGECTLALARQAASVEA